MTTVKKGKSTKASFVQVLETIDGEPHAVLLSRGKNTKVIGVAIDADQENATFFGSEISLDQWQKYVRGSTDLRFLFMFPRWRRWYYFNLHEKDGSIHLFLTEKGEKEESDFVPESGFFSYDHSEEVVDLSFKELALQKYKTDGVWDLPDFSQFYGKLSDLYAFFLSLKRFGEDSLSDSRREKIKEAFSEQPLRGGFSYVNMYSELTSIQDVGDRLSVGKLQYASPGEVDVRGRYDVFQEIAEAFEAFEASYGDLKKAYDELHDFLSENKLLRRAPDRFDNASAIAQFVFRRSNALAKKMNLTDRKIIYRLSDKNRLIYAKIVLSHFRRMEKYFMFFAEGRVLPPETVE